MADKCLTFRIFEIDADNQEHDTGKEFICTKEEHDQLYPSRGDFNTQGVLMVFFKKVFGFTSTNGYYLTWDQDPATGRDLTNQQGTVKWRGNYWRLKRVNQ